MRGSLVCAAEGCEKHSSPERDPALMTYLERISPKGKGCPFFGMCSEHFQPGHVELKAGVYDQETGRWGGHGA